MPVESKKAQVNDMDMKDSWTVIVCMVLLFCIDLVSFVPVSASQEETVTCDYYVVAGYNMTPQSIPSLAPSPSGFNFTFDPAMCDFGNITKAQGKTWLYKSDYTMMNITNLLGYEITIAKLTAEVTAGTQTLKFWHEPGGYWLGNHSLVWFDALDLNDDECNYYIGKVTPDFHDDDMYSMALGTPFPNDVLTGSASLLEADLDGDAEATGHVAPITLANSDTFTEYFGIVLWGDTEVNTQIGGTITLSLTYTTATTPEFPWLWITTGAVVIILIVVAIAVAFRKRK